jgi:hypothetical protein
MNLPSLSVVCPFAFRSIPFQLSFEHHSISVQSRSSTENAGTVREHRVTQGKTDQKSARAQGRAPKRNGRKAGISIIIGELEQRRAISLKGTRVKWAATIKPIAKVTRQRGRLGHASPPSPPPAFVYGFDCPWRSIDDMMAAGRRPPGPRFARWFSLIGFPRLRFVVLTPLLVLGVLSRNPLLPSRPRASLA